MLSKKKGNALIEIPVVIAVIAIVIVISFEAMIKANKMYKLRNDVRKNTVIFKSVVGELRYNTKYNEMKDKIGESSTFYINEENLILDKMKERSIKDLLDNNLINDKKFVQVDANKDSDVISLEISLKGANSNDLDLKELVYISENLEL
ncbi:hypothetical protein [Clostridium intestinale]|jgi:heme/copper-type cytochrome/quinol oxidase subunit 2|uniref:Prepilin-type N-terminal cleavage/methylation domain-containing protein n=1 Tax=Clostridium intestinale URNW TaxID=1294142 RepID=U2N3Y2_9CLOT|nr:hypothetical protein [Clostridium intestinale]ERK30207.1 hypothetical protein CINTURNW_1420 [Clostridium intestinale URNW]